MKKRMSSWIGFLMLLIGNAQESKKLDTIYANEKMNLALFFPTNIRQGLVGSENFVFTYNRENAQPLGLLKATKGAQSNLLVITTDGRVYSYIIRYADSLEELNRFVLVSESIGHEKKGLLSVPKKDSISTVPITKVIVPTDSLTINKRQTTKRFIEKSCATLLKRPERKDLVKRKDGMSLGIKNMVYYKDLVFLQLEIKNESGIDFDINFLKVSRVIGNNKRKSSYQELPLAPMHIYGMPNKVKHGGTARFVYVLPKFMLGDNEKLELSLKELKGNRELTMRKKL
jgi:hypothetical protein